MSKAMKPDKAAAKSAPVKTADSMSLARLLGPYVGRYRLLLAVGIAGAVIGTLISFLMGLAIPRVIDGLPADAKEGFVFLNNILAVLLAVVVLMTIIGFLSGYGLTKVATRVVRDLRHDVFRSLLGQRVSYLERQASGELQTRILADTGMLGGFSTQQITRVVTVSMSAVAGLAGAIVVSPRLTMMVLAFLPVIFLPLLIWGRKLRDFGAEVQQRNADLGKATGEAFRSIKVVHVYNKTEHEGEGFRQLADAVATTSVRSARFRMVLNTSVSLMATIATMFLMWMAARSIYSGVMSVGELMAFAFFNGLIVRATTASFGLVSAFKQTLGAAQRIMEYMAIEAHPWPAIAKPVSISGAIEFSGVHFSYPARPNIEVLRGIGFIVEAGANVVIVGPSGAGKSALFELLLGLYLPNAGTILIDGTDCRQLGREQLRAAIGYVPQKESLLSGTVFDNIAYGASSADEAKVVEAAKLACAHEFITQLPQGYQTDIGEVAARLSGGQKQRISLARALVREPKILLLDEDKSALDADSERRVADSVRKWAESRGATVISIAHRLSNIGSADRILVMDSGMIAGYGSHPDLLRGCETYRSLMSSYSAADEPVVNEVRLASTV
jgi:ATP-binding cassette, subfamily B, bacterial